jgi:hypothetical protein
VTCRASGKRRVPRRGVARIGGALLETNGVISMFRKDEPRLCHPAAPGGLRIGKRRRSRC